MLRQIVTLLYSDCVSIQCIMHLSFIPHVVYLVSSAKVACKNSPTPQPHLSFQSHQPQVANFVTVLRVRLIFGGY